MHTLKGMMRARNQHESAKAAVGRINPEGLVERLHDPSRIPTRWELEVQEEDKKFQEQK